MGVEQSLLTDGILAASGRVEQVSTNRVGRAWRARRAEQFERAVRAGCAEGMVAARRGIRYLP